MSQTGTTKRHMVTAQSEPETNRLLTSTAVGYTDEERVAAEESHAATASTVFSVRLQLVVDEAIRMTTTSSGVAAPGLRRASRLRDDGAGTGGEGVELEG
jgi:hypothetical protein